MALDNGAADLENRALFLYKEGMIPSRNVITID